MKNYRLPNSYIRIIYNFCAERDGNRCKLCSKGPESVVLTVDHIDGDPMNNSPPNLRILCKSCQMKERWRLKNCGIHSKKEACVEKENALNSGAVNELPNPDSTVGELRERGGNNGEKNAEIDAEGEVRALEESQELRIARIVEPEYRKLAIEAAMSEEGLTTHQAIYDLAERVGLSPLTTRRYLLKITSKAGPLRITEEGPRGNKRIEIRESYWEPEN